MSDRPSRDEERDQRNLAALRAARAAGDEQAARKALAALLDPYWQMTRNIAYGRLEGCPNRGDEASRIAQDTLVRVIAALSKRLDFAMPFHAVVAANREYALLDFWRERGGDEAMLHEPTELANLAGTAEPEATWVDQARSFAPYLEGLTPRERELVTERLFLDMTPQQSADRHGCTRNAVDQAYHRASAKLRANRPQPDVRDQNEEAV